MVWWFVSAVVVALLGAALWYDYTRRRSTKRTDALVGGRTPQSGSFYRHGGTDIGSGGGGSMG